MALLPQPATCRSDTPPCLVTAVTVGKACKYREDDQQNGAADGDCPHDPHPLTPRSECASRVTLMQARDAIAQTSTYVVLRTC
jgi:hypothetical protein